MVRVLWILVLAFKVSGGWQSLGFGAEGVGLVSVGVDLEFRWFTV